MMNPTTSPGKSNTGLLEIPQDSSIPYDEIDPNIVSVVRALNTFSGIRTLNSCGGHQDAGPGQNKQGTWSVVFEVAHGEDGWFALEFIAWMVHDRIRGKHSLSLRADSPPPYLNQPGASLAFVLEGWNNEDPNDLAEWMNTIRQENYVPPAHRANNGLLTGLIQLTRNLVQQGFERAIAGISRLTQPTCLPQPDFEKP